MYDTYYSSGIYRAMVLVIQSTCNFFRRWNPLDWTKFNTVESFTNKSKYRTLEDLRGLVKERYLLVLE